ncbi:helix-turn-helix domain-containing protein [Sulfuricurvum sp.]|uniref:helix-turn-helix domain-containing protein n=1 Tax=Sulfuricurvum sp. TaxID=2025608 RepID=UPI003C507FD6
MELGLEHLNLLPKMFQLIETMSEELKTAQGKRWLNVKELAEYLGYSKDRIYKIKDEHLLEGIHFYNKTGRILFDRVAIDSWVVGKETDETHKSRRQIVDNVLSSIRSVSPKS